MSTEENEGKSNFIRHIIDADLASGKHDHIVTRFPPEPNGYLHIGHAKSICLNFGLAQQYQGRCHLRFDDTNPVTEDTEYVESIQNDVRWLGFDWGENLYFASDYFQRMYDLAVHLIKKGKAYVDDQDAEAIREQRGSLSEVGTESPCRDRSVEENLDLFERMRAGEFEDGSMILRAKIDMTSPNMLMRDPVIYRIKHAHHHRTGDDWCLYPMYDYAHCLEDAFEGITHSICTLEFENNRELYDWVINETEVECKPQQIEFARLALTYTIMSKRKLLQLVKDDHVDGWDDPRMPTIAGMRRRGITPEAIRQFADTIGVAKANSTVDVGLLEFCIRDDLNHRAPRVMCVLDPIKVVITNYPDQVEDIECSYWPEDVPREGTRNVPFGKVLYIERDDFMENPPKKWHRMALGREVRLRYAYYVTCDEVIKDDAGRVTELRCTYDPKTRGGWSDDGRRVKGTLHWVSEAGSLPATVRVYDRLFTEEKPDADSERSFLEFLNPESLVTLTNARIEPSVKNDAAGSRYQFERLGFFISDAIESTPDNLVFNRIVTLRDSWAKVLAKLEGKKTVEAPKAVAKSTASTDDRPQKKSKTYERNKIRESNPVLAERFDRYKGELGVNKKQADFLTGDVALSGYFESVLEHYNAPKTVANWLVNDLLPNVDDDADLTALKLTASEFAALVKLVDDGNVPTAAGREVLAELIEKGGDPAAIVKARGLETVSDASALEPIIDQILAENPNELERYRDGKTSLLGFFIGKVMQATRGSADAGKVREMLQQKL